MKKKPISKAISEVTVKLPKKDGVKIIDSTKKSTVNRAAILAKINEQPLKSDVMPSKSNKSSTKPKAVKVKSFKLVSPNKEVTVKSTITQADDPKKKSIRLTKKIDKDSDDKSVTVEGSVIDLNRMPLDDKILIQSSNYYMNNRTIFSQFINNIFKEYRIELEKESTTLSCDKNDEFKLLTHQKIVRDYINLYTPYRGLLLYHGLGSGKTCSSIAIAEGLKSSKGVIVMTPASLRSNYIKELKFCGDKIYKKKQYWEFVKATNDELIKALSELLSIKEDVIRKNKGCWLVDIRKPANYEELSSEDKKSLDHQLDIMILSKYKFINYNGLRNSSLDTETNNGTINLFDNKVVIIDEAHNFVSRIVNKIKQPTSLSMRLYEYLLRAQNCRIILLTGTPIINYPNELGILFNILRGYILTWRVQLLTGSTTKLKKVDTNSLRKVIEKNKLLANILDYLDFKANKKELTFTRNPFAFTNRYKSTKYLGVEYDDSSQLSNDEMINELEKELNKYNIVLTRSSIIVESFKALPDKMDDFTSLFVNDNNTVKYKTLFQRRILGLTSYFPDLTQLMPRFDKHTDIHVTKIDMSDYQLKIYEEARKEERKETSSSAKKKKKNAVELYKDSTSTYRIFSRAYCNFVFPEGKRPKPMTKIISNEDALDKLVVEEKLKKSDSKYAEEDITQLEKSVDINYHHELDKALEYLKANGDMLLTPKGNNGKEGLQKYSPKFLNILENITDSKYQGLHLLYSQFRTLEGIGIFRLVLLQNGFSELKLTKSSNGLWTSNIKNDGKPCFSLYTGTEEEDEKEILRNIFNGDWETIPNSIKDQLTKISNNNNLGEIIKLLMITSSGAEGISLKNTRYVHIMEPYWHPVRTEQVIGRARRICSHTELPKELQTVEVFMYLMTFTEKQIEEASKELKLKDKGENSNRPLTSDEALYEISSRKANVNQNLLKAIKESAMDCLLHSSTGNPLKCYTVSNPNANKFTYTPDINKESSYKSEKTNVDKISWTATQITVPDALGVDQQYAWNKKDNKVYTIDSFKLALTGKGVLEQVGDMYPLDNGSYKFIPLGY